MNSRTRTRSSARIVGVVALSVGCVAATSTTAPAQAVVTGAVAPPSTGRVVQEWAALQTSSELTYTQTEAVALAKRFDVLSAVPISLKEHVPAMKQANPGLTILSYVNAGFYNGADPSSLPSSWFATDMLGRRITSSAFGNYLMEPSQLGWRDYAVANCQQRASENGFDGCVADMLTMGVFSKNYVSALPRNPATGSEYTQAEWRDQQARLAAHYTNNSPGLVIAGNCVTNEWRYWHHEVSSRPIAYALPAAQQEDFLRGAADPIDDFPVESRWVDNVNIIRDLEARGKGGLITTKVWTAGTTAQLRAWHRYAMATFLMGANGKSLFAFTTSRDKAGASGANHAYRMPRALRSPSGAMTKTGGIYQRQFTGGLVVANPTTAAVTVTLPGSYTTLDGLTLNRLTLPANSGDVLINAADTVMPAGKIGKPTAGATVTAGTVAFAGSGTDNIALRAASIAVRNRTTGLWLSSTGTFGKFAEHPATLAVPDATSTTWSRSLTLPAGSYGVQLLLRDAAGNVAKADWSTFTVS